MKKSALDIIKQIMSEVEETPPDRDIMLKEVQMMGFKIRQVTGDVGSIVKLNKDVIRSLWKIGKIDQIINDSFDELKEEDQDRLLDYLRSVEMSTEEEIRHALHTKKTSKGPAKILKLEVFKSLDNASIH